MKKIIKIIVILTVIALIATAVFFVFKNIKKDKNIETDSNLDLSVKLHPENSKKLISREFSELIEGMANKYFLDKSSFDKPLLLITGYSRLYDEGSSIELITNEDDEVISHQLTINLTDSTNRNESINKGMEFQDEDELTVNNEDGENNENGVTIDLSSEEDTESKEDLSKEKEPISLNIDNENNTLDKEGAIINAFILDIPEGVNYTNVVIHVNGEPIEELVLPIKRMDEYTEGAFLGEVDGSTIEVETDVGIKTFNIDDILDEYKDLKLKENSFILIFYKETNMVTEIVLLEEPPALPLNTVELIDVYNDKLIKIKELGEEKIIHLGDNVDKFKELSLSINNLLNISYKEEIVNLSQEDLRALGEDFNPEVDTVERLVFVAENVEKFVLDEAVKDAPKKEAEIEIVDANILNEGNRKILEQISKIRGVYTFKDEGNDNEYIAMISLGEKQKKDGFDIDIKNAKVDNSVIYLVGDEVPSDHPVDKEGVEHPFVLIKVSKLNEPVDKNASMQVKLGDEKLLVITINKD